MFGVIKHIMIWTCLCLCSFVMGQGYRIGDLYTAPDGNQGIVFFLNADGSGWVVALNDIGGGVWGEESNVPELPDYPDFGTDYLAPLMDTAGYSNTLAIRTFQNNNPNYAAGKVNFEHGWYLPAPAQLRVLYGQLPLIASQLQTYGSLPSNTSYWTSGEYENGHACIVSFTPGTGGSVSGVAKNNGYMRIRPVRSFTNAVPSTDTHNIVWSTGDTGDQTEVSLSQTSTISVTINTPDNCTNTALKTIYVLPRDTFELSQTVCGPFSWNGNTYEESGRYSRLLQATEGCDTVVILNLTIGNPSDWYLTSNPDTVCYGDTAELWVASSSSGAIGVESTAAIAVGDILCTDGSVVKPSAWPAPGKTAMGVVFFVDNSDEHGWAADLTEVPPGTTWSPNVLSEDVVELPNFNNARSAISDLNGYINTQIIRNAGGADDFPAAYAVDFLNGWYLPSAGQLRTLISELVAVNSTLQILGAQLIPLGNNINYWSSTEQSWGGAWTVNTAGFVFSGGKYGTNIRIRSIRSF